MIGVENEIFKVRGKVSLAIVLYPRFRTRKKGGEMVGGVYKKDV